MSDFIRRYIEISIGALAGAANPSSQALDVTLRGLRVSATILNAGGMQNMSQANLLIYGLSKSHLNAMSTLGGRVFENDNFTIKVSAGDDKNGMSEVFNGNVVNAWADMQTAPGVVMHVDAQQEVPANVQPTGQDTSAISHQGSVAASQLVSDLAQKAGWKFENHGVTAMINDHYEHGSILSHIRSILDAANAEGIVQNNILAIWPKGGNRGDGNLVINKFTDMVGIPGFANQQIVVKKLFDKNINLGTTMDVESEVVSVANGEWIIQRIDYALESMVPHGDWFATLYGTKIGTAVVP